MGAGRDAPTGRDSPSTLAYRIRQVEKELPRLVRRRDELVASLDGLVDHVAIARVGAELAVAQESLDEAERRWLELAERMEASKP